MIQTVFIGLAFASAITGLVTEALKKILNEIGKEYYSNVLAGISSVVVGGAIGIFYILYSGYGFTVQNLIAVFAFIVLSFLCATLGYDKVVQTLMQLKG